MRISSTVGLQLCRLALFIVPLCLSGCVAPKGQAEGEPFDLEQVSAERAELTTRVKAALVADERVAAASLQVVLDKTAEQPGSGSMEGESENVEEDSAVKGEVLRLEGFVNDQAEREAAMEIARGASQGLEVIDALEIR